MEKTQGLQMRVGGHGRRAGGEGVGGEIEQESGYWEGRMGDFKLI